MDDFNTLQCVSMEDPNHSTFVFFYGLIRHGLGLWDRFVVWLVARLLDGLMARLNWTGSWLTFIRTDGFVCHYYAVIHDW